MILGDAGRTGQSTLLRVITTALTPTYGRGSVLGFDLVLARRCLQPRNPATVCTNHSGSSSHGECPAAGCTTNSA
jgi:ABC-type Na+ transport system ATPase subunit NatA